MKIYFLPMLLSLFFLGACDKNDEIIPEDADENFITSVVMTVDGKSYTADITDNTVTITVPYTVSLNNAEVEFKYTTSATIIPDPETVTDWDNERTFRVTSYNGDAREYTYKVVKSEIESDGDVELKTTEEVASFAATKTTVVKGNLIIGSDAEEAEKITDISALASLKEVTGNIVIRNSYNGADLTGLDNIVSAGGFKSGVRQQQCSAHIFKIIQRDASKCGDLAPVGKLFECREILYLYLSLYRCQFVHSTESLKHVISLGNKTTGRRSFHIGFHNNTSVYCFDFRKVDGFQHHGDGMEIKATGLFQLKEAHGSQLGKIVYGQDPSDTCQFRYFQRRNRTGCCVLFIESLKIQILTYSSQNRKLKTL